MIISASLQSTTTTKESMINALHGSGFSKIDGGNHYKNFKFLKLIRN